MTFISFNFIVFALILLLVYYLAPVKWQWAVLLCANFIFYIAAGYQYVFYIIITTLSAYVCAIWVEKIKKQYKESAELCTTKEEKQGLKVKNNKMQKIVMAICLTANLGIWILLKYTVFISDNLQNLLNSFGLGMELSLPKFVLPLGMSFYTFIAMGYCIDVYRGKYAAEKHLGKFAAFISFFPHIIQGPFSRYNKLKETLFEPHYFSLNKLSKGCLRILWGVFKKTVIAYRFGIVVDNLYKQEADFWGIHILILMIFVTLQLYADFSGYMDIACGISHILGIQLEENFRQPFFSKSIEEFWRRWHITLGAWFRDYVFYTISMGKKAQSLGRRFRKKFGNTIARMIPSYIALFFVWTATGLWHGAAWYYLLWGWMNLFVIVTGMQLAPFYKKLRNRLGISDDSRWWHMIQIIRTFLIFGYMEMFSSSGSTTTAIRLTLSAFNRFDLECFKRPQLLLPGLKIQDLLIIFIGIAFMLFVDVMKERQISIYGVLNRIPLGLRYAGYIAIIYMVILFGNIGTDAAKGFMYAQF